MRIKPIIRNEYIEELKSDLESAKCYLKVVDENYAELYVIPKIRSIEEKLIKLGGKMA